MTPLLLALLLATSGPEAVDAGLGAVAQEPADAGEAEPAPPKYWEGDHLTGEWGGARTWLAEHGVTFDLIYALEWLADAARLDPGPGAVHTGHADVGVQLDFEAMGLWPGGKLYVLGQANHGTPLNEVVGSATEISNIEAAPYVQLGEFFYEQAFGSVLRLRLGKQDANREFGTPRFGGNFLNNNFGMLPSTPLPSYPTNGLGAVAVVQPWWWLALKAAFFEGSPAIGSFGFDSALAPNAGHFVVAGVNVMHRVGPKQRHVGTSSAVGFRQQGTFTELGDVPSPRTFSERYGFFVQHDERLFLNPADDDDPRCVTIIGRVGWEQPDRSLIGLFAGLSIAYHGLGWRKDDTVGVGLGWFSVAADGTGRPGQELFVELFYKWRLSHFLSLQPDLQYYRTPGGGRDAFIFGARLKLKL